jgi:hypothetical protein
MSSFSLPYVPFIVCFLETVPKAMEREDIRKGCRRMNMVEICAHVW